MRVVLAVLFAVVLSGCAGRDDGMGDYYLGVREVLKP